MQPRPIPFLFYPLMRSPEFENVKLFQYLDQAGLPTIYCGHLIRSGDVFLHTLADADAYLTRDSISTFNAIFRNVTLEPEINDNQLVALGSLVFNIGTGAFASSTLLALLNKGDLNGAAAQFLVWDKVHIDGKLEVSDGLLKRRTAEHDLFLTPIS